MVSMGTEPNLKTNWRIYMTGWIKTLRISRMMAMALALSIAAPALPMMMPSVAHASDIKVVVNNIAITSYDIARRKAFLQLQRRKGNLTQIATDEILRIVAAIVEHGRMDIDVAIGELVRHLEAGKIHAGDPEKDDVLARR